MDHDRTTKNRKRAQCPSARTAARIVCHRGNWTDLVLLGEIEEQASDFPSPFAVAAKAVGTDLTHKIRNTFHFSHRPRNRAGSSGIQRRSKRGSHRYSPTELPNGTAELARQCPDAKSAFAFASTLQRFQVGRQPFPYLEPTNRN